jgi:hypothetical protein
LYRTTNMNTDRIVTLRKEVRRLEVSSNRLYNKAYNARNNHNSKEWKEYRKVCIKLKKVTNELSVVNAFSQNVFSKKHKIP